jgi:hypothetical protein
MPFESLSCQRCGSADIQEVKPETYFCNHCDNVFKYVSPNQAGSTGGCEVPAGGRPCGIPAIGRCTTCSRAYCGTHQAHDINSIGLVFQTYRDWCVLCQQQRKADERALAEAKEKKWKEDRAVAAERIPILIAQFKALPFSGAVSRDYVERVAVGTKFLSPALKYKSITHQYEPAVPVGQLYWTYYKVSYDNDKPRQATDAWDTGLTQNGEFVPMDTRHLRTWVAVQLGYELRRWQEVDICECLERLLNKPSQAAEEAAAAAKYARYNLTADGKVNYADPK